MRFYVYVHVRPDGTPFYVGKGCGMRGYVLSRRSVKHQQCIDDCGAEIVRVDIQYYETSALAVRAEYEIVEQLSAAGVVLANVTAASYAALRKAQWLSESGKARTAAADAQHLLRWGIPRNYRGAVDRRGSAATRKKQSEAARHRWKLRAK